MLTYGKINSDQFKSRLNVFPVVLPPLRQVAAEAARRRPSAPDHGSLPPAGARPAEDVARTDRKTP
jgi:hypothetical protein